MARTNMFESTMMACQNAKKLQSSKNSKKNMSRKRLLQSKNKNITRKRLHENEEKDINEDDNILDNVSDDILVVVDPELDVDDYEEVIDDLQDIIDETPDGEIPTDNKYLDDIVYACPVCGNNFFSDEVKEAGETCPVCGEVPDGGFVAEGGVASAEEFVEDIEPEEVEEAEVEDEFYPEEEGEEEEFDEVLEPSITEEEEELKESRSRNSRYKMTNISLDEKKFNPLLKKYITENYKNAKDMKIVRAVMNGKTLRFECFIKFKSGKSSKATLKFEGFVPRRGSFKLAGTCVSNAIKMESSRRKPFLIEGVLTGHTMTVNKLSYNYNTRFEGKRCNVFGKCVNFQKGRRV